MKNLKTNLDMWFDKLDKRWRSLPVGKQHRYTLYCFTGYVLLTTGVLFKVWFDLATSDNEMVIEHIENPVLDEKGSPASLQDTLVDNFKNKIYEGK